MYHSSSEGRSSARVPPLTTQKVSPMAAEVNSVDGGPDATDRSPTQVGLLYVVSHRLAESGAHGIPNIQRANSHFRRIAWTLLFLAGFGMFIYQGCELIIKYYKWPINVNIEVRTLKSTQFPAVTWCNLNSIRKDALREYGDLRDLLEGQESGGFEGYPEDWDNADIDYSVDDSDSQIIDKATEIVGALPYNDRGFTGHKLNSMLLKCTFQQRNCSPRNFTTFYNYRYGNCYTFNSGANNTAPLVVTKTGPAYGLSMELYIQQDQYITGVETGAGVRILVHNQTDMPFPEDEGANVSPGKESFIGIYRVMVNRLSQPYGDCADDFHKPNLFKEEFEHLEYTKQACEKDCYSQAVLDKCHCADVKYRYNDSQNACNSTLGDTGSCIEGVESRFTDGSLDCSHCHKNCNETRYELSFSNSLWPNRQYKETVQGNIKKSNKDTVSFIGNNSDFIEENVLRVNVYYNSLNYDDIYQSQAYTVNSLASDLGGQVGLWIGVSVLTLFEFVELLVDVCMIIMTRCRAGSEKGRRATNRERLGMRMGPKP